MEVRSALAREKNKNEQMQKDMDFAAKMHRAELKEVSRKIKNMSKAEQKILKKYKIDYKTLKFDTGPDAVIGRGTYGIVKTARYFGESVAVKLIQTSSMADVENKVTQFFEEIKLTAPLSHKNIIDCYGGCWDEGTMSTCVVMELAARGNLGVRPSCGFWIRSMMSSNLPHTLFTLVELKSQLPKDVRHKGVLQVYAQHPRRHGQGNALPPLPQGANHPPRPQA